uniref:Uncharacterized protein n=1 Tax=viral metagenome TaxID=1070528 RepID=A0A6C0BKB2_9ZZZZ
MSFSDLHTSFIPKSLFDWEFYLSHNPDLKKAGLQTLEKCYRHWTSYGCYENRLVRSTKTGTEIRVKLNPKEKFKLSETPTTVSVTGHSPIDLKFKIAVMIHVFDVNLIKFFVSHLIQLSHNYCPENFEIYWNIVQEDNPYQGDLRQYVRSLVSDLPYQHCHYQYSLNRGGDIGGFLLLSQSVVNSGINYKYVMFVHSKNKRIWRIDLCRCLFDIRYEQLDRSPGVGMISAKKWINSFDPKKQTEEFRRFRYHLIELSKFYRVPIDQAFKFVAGTMFLAKYEIIQYVVEHEWQQVYQLLNRVESVDVNWLTVMNEMGKDPQGTTNDYQYRLKYRKSLHSDYMIEHTFERIIGLICQQLHLELMGH